MSAGTGLRGQVAIVTGASRGIGRGIALELGRLGANVAVVARTTQPRSDLPGTVATTVSELEGLGVEALGIAADLADGDDRARIIESTCDRFGRLDILVNNAANTGLPHFGTVWEQTLEEWRRTVEINLNAPWDLIRRAAKVMRGRGGLIVNIGSDAGRPVDRVAGVGEPGWLGAVYGTTKAAVHQMTLYLGTELAPEGIDVIGYDPGYTRTEAVDLHAATYGVDTSMATPTEEVARGLGLLAVSPRRHEFRGRLVRASEVDS
ncbi:SDR family NAD(P)-dependent oxidoreductase [Amycolatopsis sp. GM8]|uniref:SDR family NAD(P)-dependent oxidoreductase n=1 Tax=Amycolatopsis sp. GM8 TaxID=2896530 RepID=UPI001F407E93|nr:SDR family oxidoreductase [Amycolatopsis sp. GM8]